MTGPEHYREAERLLAESRTEPRPNDEGHCEADRTIIEAQVHATLALAAATAGHMAVTAYLGNASGLDVEEWADALAVMGTAAEVRKAGE